MGNLTTTDRIISKVKNHPVSSVIIVFTIILGGIASALTSIDQIWTFVEKRLSGAISTTKDEANPSTSSSTRSKRDEEASLEQLNMLIFDATGSERIFEVVVRELRREYSHWSIDTEYNWTEKEQNPMSRTLIFWQGKENEKHARGLEKRFSGPQETRSYDDNPGGFFGFDEERDVIMFIGRDWKNILNGLRRPDNALHISE